MIVMADRPGVESDAAALRQVDVAGTFRSPRGRLGRMTGTLRVQRIVNWPQGAFVTGVFTGELRDVDGSLVGVSSRRATAAADLVHEREGAVTVVEPFQLDLMGLTVRVEPIRIVNRLAVVEPGRGPGRGSRGASGPRGIRGR